MAENVIPGKEEVAMHPFPLFRQTVKTEGKHPKDHIELRYFATHQEAEACKHVKPAHVRLNSTYVASIGTNWEADAWKRVVDMVEFTNRNGICCWMEEIPDHCINIPYQNINAMKNRACLNACNQGFEWILLVDNDVLPEPDMLLNLLRWGTPVVVPFIYDPNLKVTICGPKYEQNTGLKPLKWAVQSCMLIWTKVLNCFPNRQIWHDYMLEDEFSELLYHYGHIIYQDTNTRLELATYPTYHGQIDTLDELWDFYRKSDVRRKLTPNRKANENGRKTYLPDGWVNIDKDW